MGSEALNPFVLVSDEQNKTSTKVQSTGNDKQVGIIRPGTAPLTPDNFEQGTGVVKPCCDRLPLSAASAENLQPCSI